MGLWASAQPGAGLETWPPEGETQERSQGCKRILASRGWCLSGPMGGGRPLTEPPAWCQDPLAMCACSLENNQAPKLATLLQGTASTPAVVIDSSPSPGGRGHGRAPDPTRRPPRAPSIDAGQRHDLARGRRTRPGAALWATSSPEGRGREVAHSHQGTYGEAGQQDPSQDPATGAEPRTVPLDARKHAPVTLVDAHNIRFVCTYTR